MKNENNYKVLKDPKEMSITELNAYLSSKIKIGNNNFMQYSPNKTNDNINNQSNPFLSRQSHQRNLNSNNDNQTYSIALSSVPDPSSKSAQEYIKSLQDRMNALTTENNEIKANFIQVSEMLNQERESRRKTQSSTNQFDHLDEAHELAGYKNKIKSLFQENRRLAIENENLIKENNILKERNLMIEHENSIIKLNEQKENNQLNLQLSYVNNNKEMENDNNNYYNSNCSQHSYSLSNINKHPNKTKKKKKLRSYYDYDSNNTKNTRFVSNQNIKGNLVKEKNNKSLTPTRYQTSKELNDKLTHSPNKQQLKTTTKGRKVFKKKHNKPVSTKNEKAFNDNSIYNHMQYNLDHINNNPHGNVSNSNFDYDINTNNVIIHSANSSNKQRVTTNIPNEYYKQDKLNSKSNVDSFQINCFNSPLRSHETFTFENEKERLNQLNQVIIRIQLLEQNLAQLKSSYQTFVSVLEVKIYLKKFI